MTEEYRSVLSLVVSGFKQSAREAKDAVNEVRVALDEVKQEDAFSQTASDAKDAARAVQETADAARQTGEEARRAGQEAQEAVNEAKQAVTDAAQQAERDAREAANTAKDAAAEAAQATGQIGQEVERVEEQTRGGLFSNLVQRTISVFSTAFEFISGFAHGVAEEYQAIREESAKAGESAVRSAEESAARIQTGPIEKLKSAFSSLFQGVVQGARRRN